MPDIGGAHLKKVLALVLAFACAFTMFAGAAFTDQADISQTEAVDMLTALNVIEGYEDGSFQPDEIVTRAEMAKMIYVIRNGGSDVVTQYEGYKTPFTDVENVNHWAKGYIAYCYANGIIAGTSATTFEPDRAVTGQEAAKMALVLIGYDPDRAGLVGTAWGTNTINLATQKDLFSDYTVSITAGSPRQFAAQLLYNTLWACTVRWSDDANGYEDVTTSNGTNDGVTAGLLNVTVAKKYMSLDEVTGIYAGDNKIFTGLRDTESRVYVNGDAKTITFVPEEGNSLVGEAVRVLYKEHKDGTEGLDRKDTVYGVTMTDDTTVVKATLGDIEDDKNGKIVIDGTSYDVYNNGIDVIVNFATEIKCADAEDFTDKVDIDGDGNGTLKGFKQDSADEIKFIQNDSGDIYAAYVTHVEFREVTGLTSSKITLAGLATLDIDDSMDLDDTVEQGDVVAVTTLYANDATDDDAFNVITKADVVEDVTVEAMRGEVDAPEIRIDGSYAKYASINDELTGVANGYSEAKNIDLDGTYDFVMYNGYWVAAKEVEAASKDIALVTRVSNAGISDQVRVMMADGTETVYDLDDGNSTDENLDIKSVAKDNIYAYSLVSNNGIQLKREVNGLTFVDDKTANTDVSYNEDNKTISDGSKSYVTANEAVAFVYVTNDDYYTYQIDNLKSFGGTDANANTVKDAQYVLNDDNEVVAIYVELARKPGATTSNDEYGYVISDVSRTTVDGTEYRTFSVWNGTEEVTINVETNSNISVEKGDFVKYAIDSNGIADVNDVVALNAANVGAVYSYNSGRQLLTLADGKNSANTYAVADDVVIIGVNTEDKEAAEGYNTIYASKDKDGNYLDNIVYVLNDDQEVIAIFTDVDNKIYNESTTDRSPIYDNSGEKGAIKG